MDLQTLFKELKPNTTKKCISKFINDNLFRLGFEFSPTDIELLGSFMENEGIPVIQSSVKPKSIMNNLNGSFDISFYPNETLYLQILDLNFITPFLNPLSTIETSIIIKGQLDLAFIVYLKVITNLQT